MKELPTSLNTPKAEQVEEKKAAAGSSKDGNKSLALLMRRSFRLCPPPCASF